MTDPLESRAAISRVDGRAERADLPSTCRSRSGPRELFPLAFWWLALGGAIVVTLFSCQCNRVDSGAGSSPHQPSLPQNAPDAPARPWFDPADFELGRLA